MCLGSVDILCLSEVYELFWASEVVFNNATNDYIVLALCVVNGYELRSFRYWEFLSFWSYRVLILFDNYRLPLPAAGVGV